MVDHRPLRRDDLGTPGQVEARLVIRLLGEVAVSLDGSPLLDLTTLRLQRLLGRLTLAPNAGLRRDHLAYQLWPDSTEPQARINLRKLHDLRRSLPDPDEFLDAGTHTVRWNTRASCVTSVSPRISPRMRWSQRSSNGRSQASREPGRLLMAVANSGAFADIDPIEAQRRGATVRGIEEVQLAPTYSHPSKAVLHRPLEPGEYASAAWLVTASPR